MKNYDVEKIDIEEIIDEQDELTLDKPDDFIIKYWSYNRSVGEIDEMYISKEIIIPSMQRDYVWTYEQASLFIDSIIRGLPIPSLFFTEINKKFLVIDGLQRIHTLHLFIQGKCHSNWAKNLQKFKLKNAYEISTSCRGKTYEELDEDIQRRLSRAMLNIIEFSQVSPAKSYSSMYQIFERINSTGRALDQQEIRNAAFYSDFNTNVNNVGDYENYTKLFNTKSTKRTEMTIRFLAIKFLLKLIDAGKINNKIQINLRNTLNEFMSIFQARQLSLIIDEKHFPSYSHLFDEDINFNEQIELSNFKNIIDWIKNNIGDSAFCNIKDAEKKEYKTSIQPVLCEALLLSVDEIINNNKDLSSCNNYRTKLDEILIENTFQDLISKQTTLIERIKTRRKEIVSKFCEG